MNERTRASEFQAKDAVHRDKEGRWYPRGWASG